VRNKTLILVVMGPMGCGKTTVGRLLAARLGWSFIDADDLHPKENVEKMRAGIALSDGDRYPWLERLRGEMQDHLRRNQCLVVACSALKKPYRDILGVDQASIVTVYLKGSPQLLSRRVMMREHAYMSRDLLQSQLDTLEEPEDGLWVDIAPPPEEIVQTIVGSLELAC
jgi:carbohydrate kinase (thermoresistant glucokinase family)